MNKNLYITCEARKQKILGGRDKSIRWGRGGLKDFWKGGDRPCGGGDNPLMGAFPPSPPPYWRALHSDLKKDPKNEDEPKHEDNPKNKNDPKNTAKQNMSSAVCASSMYSRLCMKMSSFLFVCAWAMPRILYSSCGIPFPVETPVIISG